MYTFATCRMHSTNIHNAFCTTLVQVDARGKKIAAVRDMAERLGLTNVDARHMRAEEVQGSFDYVLGRAVTALPQFVGWVEHCLRPNYSSSSAAGSSAADSTLEKGVLYIRGEASAEELAALGCAPRRVLRISELLADGTGGASSSSDENSSNSRGYSCIMHFPTEDLLRRTPSSAAPE
jgi:rRNA small subunit methyltransferase G